MISIFMLQTVVLQKNLLAKIWQGMSILAKATWRAVFVRRLASLLWLTLIAIGSTKRR